MSDRAGPLDLLRAVLDPLRLAVLSESFGEGVSMGEISERLDVPKKEVARAVGDLRSSGLLSADGTINRIALAEIGRSLPQEDPHLGAPMEGPWTEDEARTLGRFFSAGRLIEIPSSARKRRLVLERIAQEFEPGERYAERDVNFKIQLIHADYAAIRRYMVDEGFMDRADGAYWRTGGRYETPSDEPSSLLVLPTASAGVSLVEYSENRTQQLIDAASDERIHRYMSDEFPYPYTRERATAWIDFCMGEEPANNFLVDVDGVLRGGVGAAPMCGERVGGAEIGWWIDPNWWGRGIASAATSALIDYLFIERGFERLWAPVMAPNGASARVAAKVGMVLEGTARSAYVKHGKRYDELDFGITRAQWNDLRWVNGPA
ncbi:MAG: hypothetical protein BMS9Abin12_1905 [Acidimicrobiia bacterium]|nr:MAG: hypothetical protein BMS9Abin12_1905 [Acidimicrobiia bacterium]